jgi:hypothetical protein
MLKTTKKNFLCVFLSYYFFLIHFFLFFRKRFPFWIKEPGMLQKIYELQASMNGTTDTAENFDCNQQEVLGNENIDIFNTNPNYFSEIVDTSNVPIHCSQSVGPNNHESVDNTDVPIIFSEFFVPEIVDISNVPIHCSQSVGPNNHESVDTTDVPIIFPEFFVPEIVDMPNDIQAFKDPNFIDFSKKRAPAINTSVEPLVKEDSKKRNKISWVNLNRQITIEGSRWPEIFDVTTGKLRTKTYGRVIAKEMNTHPDIPCVICMEKCVYGKTSLTIYCKCSHSRTFCRHFKLIAQWSEKDMTFDIFATSATYNHIDEDNEAVKYARPFNGEFRAKFIEEKCGNSLPFELKTQADLDMFSNDVKTELYQQGNMQENASIHVFRKCRQEYIAKQDWDKDDWTDLVKQKESENDGNKFIQVLNYSPFALYMYGKNQFEALTKLSKDNSIISTGHLDGTGGVARPAVPGEKRLLLYSLVVGLRPKGKYFEKQSKIEVPLAEVFTTSHTSHDLKTFLSKWQTDYRVYANQRDRTAKIFDRFVTDFSYPLIYAALETFNGMRTLPEYLNNIHHILTTGEPLANNITLMYLCVAHLMKNMTQDIIKEYGKKDPKTTDRLKKIIGLQFNMTNYDDIKTLWYNLAVLLTTEGEGKEVAKATIFFDHLLDKTTDDTTIPELSDDDPRIPIWDELHNHDKDKLRTIYGQSLFYQDFEEIAFTVPHDCIETTVKNRFYNLNFYTKFAKRYAPFAPMFTGITWNLTIPKNTDRMHNNDNECWFGFVKQYLRMKQMTIGQLPLKMGRYASTIKPVILSKCFQYLYEIPANNVANKKNVNDEKRMHKRLMAAPVSTPKSFKTKGIHPELEVDGWNRSFKASPGRHLQKVGSVITLSNTYSKNPILKSRAIPKNLFKFSEKLLIKGTDDPTVVDVVDVDNLGCYDFAEEENYNPNSMEFDYIPSDVVLEFPSSFADLKTGLFPDPQIYLNNSLQIGYVVAKLKVITSNGVERLINLNYEDFATLSHQNWLSGDIIDIIFTLNFSTILHPEVKYIDTVCSQAIFSEDGLENIPESYFRKFNFESENTVVMPFLFESNHWLLIIVSFQARTIKILDPTSPNKLFSKFQYVTDCLQRFFKKVFDVTHIHLPINDLQVVRETADLPLQVLAKDTYNCGVYVLIYGYLLFIDKATERDPDLFRFDLLQYLLRSSENMIDACLLCGNNSIEPMVMCEKCRRWVCYEPCVKSFYKLPEVPIEIFQKFQFECFLCKTQTKD